MQTFTDKLPYQRSYRRRSRDKRQRSRFFQIPSKMSLFRLWQRLPVCMTWGYLSSYAYLASIVHFLLQPCYASCAKLQKSGGREVHDKLKQQSVVRVCTFCTPLFLWGQPWEVWTRYKCKQLLDRWVSVVLETARTRVTTISNGLFIYVTNGLWSVCQQHIKSN